MATYSWPSDITEVRSSGWLIRKNGLQGFWPLTNIPDIPDYAAGVTYQSLTDWAGGVDGWSVISSSGSLAVTDGKLVFTSTSGVVAFGKSATFGTGKLVRIRVKTSTACTMKLKGTVGGVADSDITSYQTFVAGVYQYFTATVSSALTNMYFYSTTIGAGGIVTVDFVYVGTGQYSSPAIDASGNGYSSTEMKAVLPTDDGLMFSIDAKSYIALPVFQFSKLSVSLNLSGAAATAENQRIIYFGRSNYTAKFLLYILTGSTKVRFLWRDSSNVAQSLDSLTTITDGTEHTVCAIHTGSSAYLIIDGIIEASNLSTSLTTDIVSWFSVGAYWDSTSYTNNFGGIIKEIECFNRELTDIELKSLAAHGTLYEAINDAPLASQYSEQKQVGVYRFTPDAGPAIQRKKFSSVIQPLDVTYSLTDTQRQELLQFYKDTLYCTDSFNYVDPISELDVEARFRGEPPVFQASEQEYITTCKLEILP